MTRLYIIDHGAGSPTSRTPSRRRGGFTPAQQAVYRPLVAAAWRAICDDHTDTYAKDRWYRETLRAELGVFTTKQLNRAGDFEKACAAFEIIAGEGIYWQLRVSAAPIERARRELDRLISTHEIEESYVNGIASQMFRTHSSNLNAEQLNKLIAALKIYFDRQVELANA